MIVRVRYSEVKSSLKSQMPGIESSLARHSDRLRLSTQSSNEEKISRELSATGKAQSNIAGVDLFDFGR